MRRSSLTACHVPMAAAPACAVKIRRWFISAAVDTLVAALAVRLPCFGWSVGYRFQLLSSGALDGIQFLRSSDGHLQHAKGHLDKSPTRGMALNV